MGKKRYIWGDSLENVAPDSSFEVNKAWEVEENG
jgi:hypothetical protein